MTYCDDPEYTPMNKDELAAWAAWDTCRVMDAAHRTMIRTFLGGYRTRVEQEPPAIDAAHVARQRAWSEATFGPGDRLLGVVDHIREELDEILAEPTDLSEWADVIILAIDGAWRAGHEPQAIIDAIKAKQAKNESREWPDWRTQDADRAIGHVR